MDATPSQSGLQFGCDGELAAAHEKETEWLSMVVWA